MTKIRKKLTSIAWHRNNEPAIREIKHLPVETYECQSPYGCKTRKHSNEYFLSSYNRKGLPAHQIFYCDIDINKYSLEMRARPTKWVSLELDKKTTWRWVCHECKEKYSRDPENCVSLLHYRNWLLNGAVFEDAE